MSHNIGPLGLRSLNPKLAIIVPYRDRKKQLDKFIKHMTNFFLDTDVKYHIFVIEQEDDKPFNQGKLLNVGFSLAEHDFNYFCFHDVDLLPEKDCDYSYPDDKPLHLGGFTSEYDYELQFQDYFGGVTLFRKEDYEAANGRSNNYWGWGFEDDDLLFRCKQAGLPIDTKFFGVAKTNCYSYLEFDGYDDFVEIKVTDELKELTKDSFSVTVSIHPELQHQVEDIPYDEHFIFSIPGYHCGLSYTSHRRYKADIFDSNIKSQAVLTDIETEYFNHLTMVYNKEIDRFLFYQNGKLVDSTRIEKLYDYTKEEYLYLGCANPANKEYSYNFKGKIVEVAIWNNALDEGDVSSLYKNNFVRSLTTNFFDYRSSESLVLYYDFKHIVGNQVFDNSGWYNNGVIHGATNGSKIGKRGRWLTVPHRRYGRYTSQQHSKSAWAAEGLHWLYSETRDNQTRFFNKVKTGYEDWHIDGLNTLKYSLNSREELSDKATIFKVEL